MKYLWLALVLTVPPASAQAEELTNGDFSKGSAGWFGDGHVAQADPDANPLDTQSAAPAQGLTFKLSPSHWSIERQNFTPHIKEGRLTIVYSTDESTTFSQREEDYKNVPSQLGCTLFVAFDVSPSQFVTIFQDSGKNVFQYKSEKLTPGSALRTMNFRIGDLVADAEKLLILAFPPGHGIVIVHSVSLSELGN